VTKYGAFYSHIVTIKAKVMQLIDTLRQLVGYTSYDYAAFIMPDHEHMRR
jgi:hypothetical protein